MPRRWIPGGSTVSLGASVGPSGVRGGTEEAPGSAGSISRSHDEPGELVVADGLLGRRVRAERFPHRLAGDGVLPDQLEAAAWTADPLAELGVAPPVHQAGDLVHPERGEDADQPGRWAPLVVAGAGQRQDALELRVEMRGGEQDVARGCPLAQCPQGVHDLRVGVGAGHGDAVARPDIGYALDLPKLLREGSGPETRLVRGPRPLHRGGVARQPVRVPRWEELLIVDGLDVVHSAIPMVQWSGYRPLATGCAQPARVVRPGGPSLRPMWRPRGGGAAAWARRPGGRGCGRAGRWRARRPGPAGRARRGRRGRGWRLPAGRAGRGHGRPRLRGGRRGREQTSNRVDDCLLFAERREGNVEELGLQEE